MTIFSKTMESQQTYYHLSNGISAMIDNLDAVSAFAKAKTANDDVQVVQRSLILVQNMCDKEKCSLEVTRQKIAENQFQLISETLIHMANIAKYCANDIRNEDVESYFRNEKRFLILLNAYLTNIRSFQGGKKMLRDWRKFIKDIRTSLQAFILKTNPDMIESKMVRKLVFEDPLQMIVCEKVIFGFFKL